jgi:putative membrane protein
MPTGPPTRDADDSERRPERDPRVYLAAERTFLAWIRTGLALMGFGFVVARFGLFMRELAGSGTLQQVPSGASTTVGTALVFLGVLLTVGAVFRYLRLINELNSGAVMQRPSKFAVALGVALATVGGAISIYLLVGF